MRKSKLLTVLVAAAIGVSMVGCGSSGGSSSSGSGASSSGGDVANKDKPLCWYNRQPSNSSTGELDKTALTKSQKTCCTLNLVRQVFFINRKNLLI